MPEKSYLIINIQNRLERNREGAISELLEWYGDKGVFEKRLAEGYSQVSFGTGPWFHMDLQPDKYARFLNTSRIHTSEMGEVKNILPAEAIRIVSVWVFYHPDGKAATFEHLKLDAYGWHHPGPKIECEFANAESFQEFCQDFEIQLIPKMDLTEVNKCWRKS